MFNKRGFSHIILLLIVGIILAVSSYFYLNPTSNRSVNKDNFNVMIIGWDGAQYDFTAQCLKKEQPFCKDGLPGIEQLTENGKRLFVNVTSSGATRTVAAWPQIMTGYRAEYTGITDTRVYKALPKGATVFEKVEKHLGDDNILTVFAGSTGKVSSACAGEKKETVRSGDSPVEGPGGGPYCITKEGIDEFHNDKKTNDDVGNKLLEMLDANKDQRFLMFGHFFSPDSEGHDAGFESEEYAQGYKTSDKWLEKITNKLKELGLYEKTYIYVVSDHGWDLDPSIGIVKSEGAKGATDHSNAPFAILATNDVSIVRPGDRMDLTPTILKKFGASLGEDKELNLAAVDGYPLDQALPMASIPEGGLSIEYPGSVSCSEGTTRVPLKRYEARGDLCTDPQGGKDVVAGLCVTCGNNKCDIAENPCSCPVDCKKPESIKKDN